MKKIFLCSLFFFLHCYTQQVKAYDSFFSPKLSLDAALTDFKGYMDYLDNKYGLPRKDAEFAQDYAQTQALLTMATDDDENVSKQQLAFIKKAYRAFLQTLYPKHFGRVPVFYNKNLDKIMQAYMQTRKTSRSIAPSKPKFAEEQSTNQPHSRRRKR
jgi:hypothetical protein